MPSMSQVLRSARDRRELRRARLPWAELEAEAIRQDCSPADIFFDGAGRPGSEALATSLSPPGRGRPATWRPRVLPRNLYGRPVAPRPLA